MAIFSLKTYQSQALDSLRHFLTEARSGESLQPAWAAEMGRQEQSAAVQALPYRTDPFGDVPCICLRIPTGGGKTLLAAHAIALMAKVWRDADFPVALWLVPSTTIRDQTLKALQTSGHPYRAALEAEYGQALSVLDLDAAPTLAPQDFGHRAIVLVATMQSFRVKQTQGRNVYAFSEEFDAHFKHFEAQIAASKLGVLERVTQADLDEADQSFLRPSDLGRVKHSLANLLALASPIIVVDEAHNAKTDTTFATLKRIAPCAILELTATPVPKRTNVLYSVTARELEAEDMIKLPIMLAEHTQWEDAVRDAVLRRKQLEGEALHEEANSGGQSDAKRSGYLRPLVLFQAHDKNGAAPPEVLRQHLIDQQHIPANEIVIATGDQRGLDGLDLFDRNCPVRFVITVEALKEGWDCSFAYVLCSLQNVRSSKDVEQLLGRVLRMPYARKRISPALNRAYAHVVARSFSEAASALADRMVAGMGFETLDAAQVLLPDPGFHDDLFGEAGAAALPAKELELQIDLPSSAALALAGQPDIRIAALSAPMSVDAASGEAPMLDIEPQSRVTLTGEVSDALAAQVLAATPTAERPRVSKLLEAHQARVQSQRSPSQRGIPFAPLPRLCVQWQGELQLLERETLAELVEFDLLRVDPRPELPGFALLEQSDMFEIFMNKSRVEWRRSNEAGQLTLDSVPSQANEHELLTWLTQVTRRDSLTPSEHRAWLGKLLSHLQGDKGLSLTGLVRARHTLAQTVTRRLEALEASARKRGFDQLVLPGLTGRTSASRAAEDDATVTTSDKWRFRYVAGQYPARNVYTGRQRFNKHWFRDIHALKAQGEEFECAQMLDRHAQIKHWVRNIERQPQFSFWLPTATDYFYPDFVAELIDGRLLVVEYKGDAYATNDDSREKNAVGRAWAGASSGTAMFTFIEKKVGGLDMTQQLNSVIALG
jgi:type III restriction enzyme